MPFISLKTNKTLTHLQEQNIKEVSGKLISIIPNKSEEYLMVHIYDQQVMYYQGNDQDCMMIEVKLYRSCDQSYKEDFTRELINKVSQITNIPIDNIYLTIDEYQNWGLSGELY